MTTTTKMKPLTNRKATNLMPGVELQLYNPIGNYPIGTIGKEVGFNSVNGVYEIKLRMKDGAVITGRPGDFAYPNSR